MAQVALEPQVGSGPDAAPSEIAGRSPWALAWRRFRRNKPAIGALVVFVLIVVVSLSAPLYAHRIAHVDPFTNNLNGTTIVNGKKVALIQQGGGKLGLGETPIGPTWDPHHYFLGADSSGRDVARADPVRRTQLAADRDRVGRDLFDPRDHPRPDRRVLRRRVRLGALAHDGRDLGVPGDPVRALRRNGAAHRPQRPASRPRPHRGVEPVAADADHRADLHPLRLPAGARQRAVRAGEGVRPGGDRAGRVQQAAGLQRGAAQHHLRRHRAAPADDRDDHPHRGGTLVPRRRRPGAGCELGHDHRGRPAAALHAPVGRHRPGHHDPAHRALAERAG